jgi:hypothetical protein
MNQRQRWLAGPPNNRLYGPGATILATLCFFGVVIFWGRTSSPDKRITGLKVVALVTVLSIVLVLIRAWRFTRGSVKATKKEHDFVKPSSEGIDATRD